MTDFYAALETQLVEAGRRRLRRGPLRRALARRARPLLVALACAVAAVAASAALMPRLADRASDRDAAPAVAPPASEVPAAGEAPASGVAPADGRPVAPPEPSSLRGVRVAVLNGTLRSGAARALAERVERRGAIIVAVGNGPDQAAARTTVAYRPGAGPAARAVARVLGVELLRPMTASERLSSQEAAVVVIAGSDA